MSDLRFVPQPSATARAQRQDSGPCRPRSDRTPRQLGVEGSQQATVTDDA